MIGRKTIEMKYVYQFRLDRPHLRELQTNIHKDITSQFDSNLYLEPPLPIQLRELYVKICDFYIKFNEYRLHQLVEKVGLKYRCLFKKND